jgi:transcriptional regulator with XRE-family HTH domain
MRQLTPTVRARELGLALRRAVATTGMEGSQLARQLGCSSTKISNIYSGHRHPSEIDVAAILGICGITGPARDNLLKIAREAHEPGWWQDYDDRLPAELQTVIDYEDSAISITNFSTDLVPGLLQVPDYARALMRAMAFPDEEIEPRVKARLRRHELFNRNWPPRFTFMINELALRRTGPGREIMSEQVHHLLRMSVRSYVEIRIIPDAVGFHAAVNPFHLMKFTELHPVVHVESDTSVLFLERKETTSAYRRKADALARVALSEGQSKDWIASLATALGEPRKGDDGPVEPGGPDMAEEFPHLVE